MARKELRFDSTDEDSAKIIKIVLRAVGEMADIDRLAFAMDITAVHLNGCPLDLDKLLTAPSLDFAHDIVGIIANIDRRTGKLRRHFLPRCALPAPKRLAPIIGTARA
jgi:hypothetical protein